MEKRKYTVYMHTCNTNEKRYVGITKKEPKHRWNNGNGYKEQMFYRAIQKYGWDNFKHEIILCNLTKEEAEMFEVEMIKYYKTTNPKYGYNLDSGGSLNKEVSQKTRDRMRIAKLGTKASEETKNKMRLKSKIMYANHDHCYKPVMNLDTCETFPSILEAALRYNIKPDGIGCVCNGRYVESKGMRWAFIDKNNKIITPKCNKRRQKRRVKNITTGMSFDSIKDANLFYGKIKSNIDQVCRGKRTYCFGCEWEYLDN